MKVEKICNKVKVNYKITSSASLCRVPNQFLIAAGLPTYILTYWHRSVEHQCSVHRQRSCEEARALRLPTVRPVLPTATSSFGALRSTTNALWMTARSGEQFGRDWWLAETVRGLTQLYWLLDLQLIINSSSQIVLTSFKLWPLGGHTSSSFYY